MMLDTQFLDIDKQENSDGSGGSISGSFEPVTVSEVKKALNIDDSFTDDDAYIASLISAARGNTEALCHISIVEKIITLTTTTEGKPRLKFGPSTRYYDGAGKDYCEPNSFELPEGPVIEVISVTAINSDGTTTALILDSDYFIKGTLYKTISIVNSSRDNIFIYKTGYDPAKIPGNLKLAIVTECVFRYENRGDKSNRYARQDVGMCEGAEYLARKFQRLSWI